ncbi:MAG: hypothetical protein Q9M46_07600 [Ghiorsea sp.]|nr:hypothetical protein [Ghiorsea sp.]
MPSNKPSTALLALGLRLLFWDVVFFAMRTMVGYLLMLRTYSSFPPSSVGMHTP